MEGTPPKGAEWSVKCLEESASDFHKKKVYCQAYMIVLCCDWEIINIM